MWWVPLAAAAVQGMSQGAAQPKQAAPITSGGITNSWMDNSGWTVATSGSSARGGDRHQADGGAASAGGISPVTAALIAGSIVVAAIVLKKMR